MTYAYKITCLVCREPATLESIDPIEQPGDGETWIRLTMGCGHTPSLPEHHRAAIERLAIGTSGGFTFYDPDGRATFVVRAPNPGPDAG